MLEILQRDTSRLLAVLHDFERLALRADKVLRTHPILRHIRLPVVRLVCFVAQTMYDAALVVLAIFFIGLCFVLAIRAARFFHAKVDRIITCACYFPFLSPTGC